MLIALVQMNNVIGDIYGNKEKILKLYEKAKAEKVDIVIFPELAVCGYTPQDFIEKVEFRDTIDRINQEIASKTDNNTAIIFGTITQRDENVGTGVYNSAVMAFDGKIQFIQDKTLLPNYDVFDERRYFESAKSVEIFEFKDEKLGISVCEDIWNDDDYWKHRRYENDPVETLIEKGTSLLLNISASPYGYGRRKERFEMLSTLTKTNKIPLAYVCTVGAQTDLIFDGASMCYNSKGDLVKIGKKYDEDFILFNTKENYSPIIEFEGSYGEEIISALTYGLKEYLSKTGFKKVVLGLSGGIDSAVVAFIAANAIGKENVTAVMLPSEISSEGSIIDSEKLIKNLGINSLKIPIINGVNTIQAELTSIFSGTESNVAEENIQSRLRGLYLMALSNKFNWLLLTTGNKSEIAVGYATLYGDMNGGLAVIGDVYKTQIYQLAEYINRNEEIIPNGIIQKAPSAELKPNQTDQDTLPEYHKLDAILTRYLEDYKEYHQIVAEVGESDLVQKVLRWVDLNEYKRFQAPPVLRVTTKAYGYGRRFPIVQGWRK